MSNVVSQSEIKKYGESGKAVFPAGTIITPSAWDWANEHNIKISFGELDPKDKDDCLKAAVKAVLKEFTEKCVSPDVQTVAEAVKSCLEKLGCKVEK